MYKSGLMYKARNESFAYFSNSGTSTVLSRKFFVSCPTGDSNLSGCQKPWLRILDGQDRPSRRRKQVGERQASPHPNWKK